MIKFILEYYSKILLINEINKKRIKIRLVRDDNDGWYIVQVLKTFPFTYWKDISYTLYKEDAYKKLKRENSKHLKVVQNEKK